MNALTSWEKNVACNLNPLKRIHNHWCCVDVNINVDNYAFSFVRCVCVCVFNLCEFFPVAFGNWRQPFSQSDNLWCVEEKDQLKWKHVSPLADAHDYSCNYCEIKTTLFLVVVFGFWMWEFSGHLSALFHSLCSDFMQIRLLWMHCENGRLSWDCVVLFLSNVFRRRRRRRILIALKIQINKINVNCSLYGMQMMRRKHIFLWCEEMVIAIVVYRFEIRTFNTRCWNYHIQILHDKRNTIFF